MSTSIDQYYAGKGVFITGVTGFLGQSIFEKYLRCCPDAQKFFILIRPLKGESVAQRFKKTVITSPIFDRLRKQLGNAFQSYISEKVGLIQGDLLKPNLGLSKENQANLIENCNVFINCAASVDFNSPLNEAIQMNIDGSVRMFELSLKVRDLHNFCHVSTCYVSSYRPKGRIQEDIYDDFPEKADTTIKRLKSMPVDDLLRDSQQILGKYANTYVFTQCLTERFLNEIKPSNYPLTIIRPSIIGAAHRDPFKGWVEGVTACTAVCMLIGLGVLKYLNMGFHRKSDIIPVDYVADWCIIVPAIFAKKPGCFVFHAGTTDKNPTSYATVREMIQIYWTANQPEQRVGPPQPQLYVNKTLLHIGYFSRRFPVQVYQKFANTFGTSKMQMDANRAMKMVKKSEEISNTFGPFSCTNWIFDTTKSSLLMDNMTDADKQIFNIDVTKINWRQYFLMYNWGIHRYILQENIEPPFPDESFSFTTNVLRQMQPESRFSAYFNDIQWSLNAGLNVQTQSPAQYQKVILTSPRVIKAMKDMIDSRAQQMPGPIQNNFPKCSKDVQKIANDLMTEIMADYSMPMLRFVAWSLHKIFQKIYEQVVIDVTLVQQLKAYDPKQSGPLILIPSHRSYIDFMLVSYIFYAYKIKCPHIAATEDFLKVSLVNHMFRSCGSFFMKKKKDENTALRRTIFYEYVQQLLINDEYIQYFVEGSRSRSYQMLHPKLGMMSIITDCVYDNKIKDATIVPITISYEQVLEGDTFPYQLLGEEQIQESLSRMINATRVLNQNYGRIYVEIGKGVSIRNYTENYLSKTPTFVSRQVEFLDKEFGKGTSPVLQISTSLTPSSSSSSIQNSVVLQDNRKLDPFNQQDDRTTIVKSLSYEIIHRLTDQIIVTPTNIVATILLMHRKGISEKLLIDRIQWLTVELIQRGAKIGSENDSSSGNVVLKSALNLLKSIILKNKKNVFQMSLSAQKDYKNVLMLSYYRNGLVHIFMHEAIVAVAINSFANINSVTREAISILELWQEFRFLMNFLSEQYVLRLKVDSLQAFESLIAQMRDRGSIAVLPNGIVKVKDELMINFLCSLVWPLIDSYWAAISYLFTLQSKVDAVVMDRFQMNLQWFATSLYDDQVFDFFESSSMETIKNAIKRFEKLKLVEIVTGKEDQKGSEPTEYIQLIVPEEQLVKYENRLSQFLKCTFNGQSITQLELSRKNILNDYQIVPKL